MRLTAEEEAMLAGEMGEAARWGIELQVRVGEFFDADNLVPIRSAHVMCDAEAAGTPGVELLEHWVSEEGRVRVPTTTDPRSTDFSLASRLGQDECVVGLETRIVAAFHALGAIPSNTCINYQVVDAPRYGEHLGWGDTGSVIFANSVAGARSNFEGGPAGLAAALAGRVAAYGYHLDEERRATLAVELRETPRSSSDWGALGCLVGRAFPSYWEVPVFTNVNVVPTPDDLKQLGASLASHGSQAMFHMVGVTPEADTVEQAFGGGNSGRSFTVQQGDLDKVYASFVPESPQPDLIVFGTPQLSLFELRGLVNHFAGKRAVVPVFMTTSPQVKREAEALGYADVLVDADVTLLGGVCFYLMTARELAQRHGFRTILTDSAKLANIIEGYGYNPVLRTTQQCVEAAQSGVIPGGPS